MVTIVPNPLSRAQFFAQLGIASSSFRALKIKNPTRKEVADHLAIEQYGQSMGEETGITGLLYTDEQLMTLCHEAIVADLVEPLSVSRVLSAFEFAWERYKSIVI